MEPKKLWEKLNDAGVGISDSDKKWLEIVHSYADREERPTKAELLTRHFEELPENFRPSDVNGALQKEAREGDDIPKLTTLGTLLVAPDSQTPLRIDSTIRTIQNILKEEPGKTEVSAGEVADHMMRDPDLPDLGSSEIEKAFGDLDDLGGFRTGASRRKGLETGYSEIRFGRGAERIIPNYLGYEGFEQLINRKIQKLKEQHEGSGGLLKTQPEVGGSPAPSTGQFYVAPDRIDQLQAIESEEFDLTRLITLCEELNDCYQSRSYHAIAMLVRSIMDHVPPVFGFRSFDEVVNNDGKVSRSLREAMEKLNDSYRKIADRHLHDQIRSSESLPTWNQVDFTAELDLLLMEIERRLKE